MAHTPHAFAAAKVDHERPFEASSRSTRSAQEAANEVLRADGLNAIERSEREAALDENRAEEAEIFERAAARLKPSWATADAMLELGLANALPQVADPAPAAEPAPVQAPAANDAALSAPIAAVSAAFAAPAFAMRALPARAAPYASVELTDRFSAHAGVNAASLARRTGSFLRQRRIGLIAVAIGCVGLGGAWAAFSGSAEPAPQQAPAAVTVAPPPPPPAEPPPAPPAASEEPAAPARKPAPKMGKPLAKRAPAAQAKLALKPAAKPSAAKPAASKPFAAKSAAKPLAKKPAPQKGSTR